MKKIWKIRKDSEAVSPVIATILMVAITVVLAAVLYVMVMGFTPGGGQTPSGAFTSDAKLTATTYKLTFGAVSPDAKFVDCKFRIDPVSTSAAVVTTYTVVSVGSVTPAVGATNAGIAITDIGSDGKISVGDYITITIHSGAGVVADNGDWTVTLIFTSTGGQICQKVFAVTAA
ncbi:MAG: type IV pilin N-terminal domain-containing protein [Methanomassiliicoccales archaeon]|nr:type IV pilin N-terminal domain-containing protein [Methanomassiliicoccales archaeon]